MHPTEAAADNRLSSKWKAETVIFSNKKQRTKLNFCSALIKVTYGHLCCCSSVQVSFCPVTQLLSGLRSRTFRYPWCSESGVLHVKEIMIHTTIAITTTEIDKWKTYIYDKRNNLHRKLFQRWIALKIVPEMNGVTCLKRLEVWIQPIWSQHLPWCFSCCLSDARYFSNSFLLSPGCLDDDDDEQWT